MRLNICINSGYSVRKISVETIILECAACGTRKKVSRDKLDPSNAVKIVSICPDCISGTLAMTFKSHYVDENNKEIKFSGK